MSDDRYVRFSLSMKQAKALLYAAEIGDRRIEEQHIKGGHRARWGAIRILQTTINNVQANEKEPKP